MQLQILCNLSRTTRKYFDPKVFLHAPKLPPLNINADNLFSDTVRLVAAFCRHSLFYVFRFLYKNCQSSLFIWDLNVLRLLIVRGNRFLPKRSVSDWRTSYFVTRKKAFWMIDPVWTKWISEKAFIDVIQQICVFSTKSSLEANQKYWWVNCQTTFYWKRSYYYD